MKRYQFVKDYLSFNRSELRGIIVLLVILFIVAFANQLLPEDTTNFSADYPNLEKELLGFEAAVRKAETEDSLKRLSRYKGMWPKSEKHTDSGGFTRYPAKPLITVDINRADTLELQRLKGIGPSYARRIVQYRNKLGGFINVRQVLEVWGMDSIHYNLIRQNIIIKEDTVRRIDLNTITFKELLKHPYFPYELTRSLVIYRQKHKVIRSVDELKLVEGVNDSVFGKIRPYVKLNSEIAK
ncbi:MAG: helix-hairpin-helix domain-containing protein [Bacteroidota bacterium]